MINELLEKAKLLKNRYFVYLHIHSDFRISLSICERTYVFEEIGKNPLYEFFNKDVFDEELIKNAIKKIDEILKNTN